MATIKGRRGARIDVTDSSEERRARLESIAGVVVLIAALAIVALIGVLVLQVRGAL